MTSQTVAGFAPTTEIEDLVPSEAALQHASPDPAAPAASFPKVLRRRLERFFADAHLSPKADPLMWTKIALGTVVLFGSWIAIYARCRELAPSSTRRVIQMRLEAFAVTSLSLVLRGGRGVLASGQGFGGGA